MWLNCEQSTAQMRPIASRLGKRRCAKRNSGQPAGGSDPVRALRISMVLDRTVAAGFGPPDHLPARRLGGCPAGRSASRGSKAEVFERQVAIYLAHVGCGFTYTQAARLYGRDRSTAAHACRVVEDRRDDLRIDRILELLEGCARMALAQIEPALAGERPRF
jgi:hypothetical protein